MATDTAFAIALIAVMGAHVPIELRVFLTAAAIVDDIGAIVVVAAFLLWRDSSGLPWRSCGRGRGTCAFEPVVDPPAIAVILLGIAL
jgi:hypothetical protein